jgi:hypothetical protein
MSQIKVYKLDVRFERGWTRVDDARFGRQQIYHRIQDNRRMRVSNEHESCKYALEEWPKAQPNTLILVKSENKTCLSTVWLFCPVFCVNRTSVAPPVGDHITELSRFEILYMRCDYKVLGMILLRAYLYTYSLLRGVTFDVLPFSSFALFDVFSILKSSSL